MIDAGVAPVAVTVTVALPDFPSLAAMIEALPAATPVTMPDPFTVATFGFDEVHTMVRVDAAMGFPDASDSVAVACVVAPTPSELFPRLTETLPTGTALVTAVVCVTDVPAVSVSVTDTVTDPAGRPERSNLVS